MRFSIAILAVFSVFYLATSVPATIIPAGESGVVYNCAYPFTVTLDGSFVDWPDVTWEKVDSTMGWSPFPSSDADGSLEFACVADNDYLYVGILVKDDAKCVDENIGDDVYLDDSVEIYIDGDNSKSSEYEADVCQITTGRYNVNGDLNNPKLNNFRGLNDKGAAAGTTGTKASVVDTDYGWAVEVAIPLTFFKIPPKDGTVIGFNVQLNDDDDRDIRDHKLSWSKVELKGEESSYYNPSVFAELKFILADLTAVSSNGKLATTWSSLKK
jgi:endo-1,4-beta-xylanase